MEKDQKEIASVFEQVFHNGLLVQKIIRNLPLSQRWNLAATDKKLYSIICELDAKKHYIKLSRDHYYDRSTIVSILNSKREFDEIHVSAFENQNLYLLKHIAKKHGQNVKKFYCSWDSYHGDALRLPLKAFEAIKLEAFFKELPNVIELDVHLSGNRAFIFDDMFGKCAPVLKTLKKFSYIENRFSTHERKKSTSFSNFSSLIASDTIEDFHYFKFNASCRDFIKRQSKIKSLDVLSISDVECLSHLKLEVLGHIPLKDGNARLQKLIRDHEKTLKSAYTRFLTLREDTVGLLCERLQVLEHLSITITNGNVQSFLAIERLKELKSLDIFCESNFNRFNLLLDLTRLKLPSIKSFNLYGSNRSIKWKFNEIARNIGDNWENLEAFGVDETFAMMNGILEHAKKLKALKFNIDPFGRDKFQRIFKYNGETYPLMEEFHSNPICDLSFITTLNIFPHLQKLWISCLYEGPSQLKSLIALKKLKELHIRFHVESSLATASDEEISLFKQLCHQIKEFLIGIKCPSDSNFCVALAAELNDHLNENYQSGTLFLRSKKY